MKELFRTIEISGWNRWLTGQGFALRCTGFRHQIVNKLICFRKGWYEWMQRSFRGVRAVNADCAGDVFMVADSE
jgi:hypothetical protein